VNSFVLGLAVVYAFWTFLLSVVVHYVQFCTGNYNLGHKGWKKHHSIHILPFPSPVQCCKTLSSSTSLNFTIFQHLKGEWGAATHSVGITVMISCFWHFTTQFVHLSNPSG